MLDFIVYCFQATIRLNTTRDNIKTQFLLILMEPSNLTEQSLWLDLKLLLQLKI